MKKLLLSLLFCSYLAAFSQVWIPNTIDTISFNDVHFADYKAGVIVGTNGRIKTTADGGLTWVPRVSGTIMNITDVYMKNPMEIYACAGAQFYKSTDNGNTWSPGSITPPAGLMPIDTYSKFQFCDQNTGFGLVHASVSTYLLKTSNGGAAWDTVYTSGMNYITDFHFVDTLHGYAVSNGGKVLKTINGGQTWNQINTPYTINSFTSVWFVSPQVGFIGYSTASVTGMLLRTRDGGATFDTVYNAGIGKINFASNKVGFAIVTASGGTYLNLIKTKDGGETWQIESTPATQVKAIHFITENFGGTVGDNGNFTRFFIPMSGFDFRVEATSDPKQLKFINMNQNITADLLWTFGDGSYFIGKDPVHLFQTDGKYKVCMSPIKASVDTNERACKDIYVGNLPCNLEAKFNIVDTLGKRVTLLNTTFVSASSIANFFWTFGDGATSIIPNPQHQYTKDGSYLITLSVRDTAKACFDYYSEYVKIGNFTCNADFNYDYFISAGDTMAVKFLPKLAPGTGIHHLWNFGDGTFSSLASPVKQYNAPGLYPVSLFVSSTTPACSNILQKKIQVGDIACDADFETHTDSVDNTVYFEPVIYGNANAYYWQFGDGATFMGKKPKHTYSQSGYYNAVLSIYDSATQCMNRQEKTILVGKQGNDCEADFYYKMGTDGSVNFTNNSMISMASPTYRWVIKDADSLAIITTKNTNYTYKNFGYHNVCLTIRGGTCSHTKCKVVNNTINLSGKCLAQFKTYTDSITKKVTFVNASLGTYSDYMWHFGDGTTSTLENPIKTYADTGYYPVKLEVKQLDSVMCTGYGLVNVGGQKQMKAAFVYEKSYLKSMLKKGGYPIDFVGISTGSPAQYVWDFGDGSGETGANIVSHEYINDTTYLVCYTVTDSLTQQSDVFCEEVLVSANGVQEIMSTTSTFNVYPNPVGQSTNIHFILDQGCNVKLSLIDITGRTVQTIMNTSKAQGEYNVVWEAGNLARGIYFMKMETGSKSETRMIVKE